jgi:hypothetical protein
MQIASLRHAVCVTLSERERAIKSNIHEMGRTIMAGQLCGTGCTHVAPGTGEREIKEKFQEARRSFLSNVMAGVLAVLFFAALPNAATASECADAGDDVTCTDLGAVRGSIEGGTLAFKGIPYAKPPVGDLRWRAPQPAEPWTGTRDGSRYGAMCPQILGKSVEGNEDCLFVNIWRPL